LATLSWSIEKCDSIFFKTIKNVLSHIAQQGRDLLEFVLHRGLGLGVAYDIESNSREENCTYGYRFSLEELSTYGRWSQQGEFRGPIHIGEN
jgi:hypothetical protein